MEIGARDERIDIISDKQKMKNRLKLIFNIKKKNYKSVIPRFI